MNCCSRALRGAGNAGSAAGGGVASVRVESVGVAVVCDNGTLADDACGGTLSVLLFVLSPLLLLLLLLVPVSLLLLLRELSDGAGFDGDGCC